MKRLWTSALAKLVFLLAGFVGAVGVVASMSVTYRYYLRQAVGDVTFAVGASFVLLVVGVGLACTSWWMSSPKDSAWHRTDYLMLVLAVLCVDKVCWGQAYIGGGDAFELVVLSVVSYLVTVGLVLETLTRVRAKRLGATLYWTRFLQVHPLSEPIGILMALALFANLVGLAFVALAGTTGGTTLFLMAFLFFMLIALTYVCAFTLSAATRYEQANEDKVRAERFKAELIANVSHDVRTPLTSIVSYVGLLKGLPVERTDFAEYVSVLDRKAARLNTLLEDLMEASKLTTGNVAVNLQTVDLVEIVGQIAGEVDDRFLEQDLTLVLRQPDGPVLAVADSRHLWRVLENLFGNAAKYALAGTRVFAEIVREDETVTLALKNTSREPIDLPAEALTEQFIRGDKSRHTDGNGLGLYIAKSLVEAMGGTFAIVVSGDLFEASVRLPAASEGIEPAAAV